MDKTTPRQIKFGADLTARTPWRKHEPISEITGISMMLERVSTW